MTYIERMAIDWAYHKSHDHVEELINQVIIDTKRACKLAIRDEVDTPPIEWQTYLQAIDDATVKE